MKICVVGPRILWGNACRVRLSTNRIKYDRLDGSSARVLQHLEDGKADGGTATDGHATGHRWVWDPGGESWGARAAGRSESTGEGKPAGESHVSVWLGAPPGLHQRCNAALRAGGRAT